jgi:anaerobic magnesium-protoporphyrin IX monomethyl ester cyclase
MNVALINPPTSFEQIYGDWDLSRLDTYCPPIGLLHLASFIRAHQHVPQVVDMEATKEPLHEAINRVLSSAPDVVGISAKTINVLNAGKIAEGLRVAGFEGPIVLGGAHVTAVPEETLGRFHSIDVGVIGEGEITFLELIDRFQEESSLEGVEGIAWRKGAGQVVVNPPRALIEDLDILPLPAWDLLVGFPAAYPHNALETKRLPAASIMTSRGCPFQCTFCDRAIFGSKVRQHSAEYSLRMVRQLRDEYGVRDLMILDDNFLLDKRKLFTICEAMIEEKMSLSWYCQGHAKLMTEDLLRKIKEAGCWFVEMGIESGSDRILKLIKKGTTKSEIAQAVKRARVAGLKVKGNFIFGFPTETLETLEETTRFATSIGLSYFQQNFLTIWPGCELALNAEQYGSVEADWGRLAHQRVTFVPHGLTERELIQASKNAFRRFYMRPAVALQILMQAATSLRAAGSILIAAVVFAGTLFRRTGSQRAATG